MATTDLMIHRQWPAANGQWLQDPHQRQHHYSSGQDGPERISLDERGDDSIQAIRERL
jgi:hypothetical protein